MESITIPYFIVSGIIVVIGFFIRMLISDIKKGLSNMKDEVNKHETRINVLEKVNDGFEKRLDELFEFIRQMNIDTKDSMRELSNDIKQLTKELSNKKDRNEK